MAIAIHIKTPNNKGHNSDKNLMTTYPQQTVSGKRNKILSKRDEFGGHTYSLS